MGTRADFYVGIGTDAEWIGSIAWDGYSIDEAKEGDTSKDAAVKFAKTEEEYRAAVKSFFEDRDDVTEPSNGWPWPWDDSTTTDYAYSFIDGSTQTFLWGEGADWPDMSTRKNVQRSSIKSGLIVIA